MAAAAKPRKKAAKGHKLPELISQGFQISDTTKKSWIIGEEIGSGGFGRVYYGAEATKPKDVDYVIKVEYHANGPLFAEMHCYQKVGKPELIADWTKKKKMDYLGLSPCYGIGSFEYNNSKYRFMIIQRYGKDLQKLLEENQGVFPLKTVYLVGISVVNVLEYIHHSGYLHGDIKAANLLLGRKKGTENQVYLVDLGLACKYTRGDVHKKQAPDPKKAHNGTLEFTSRDAHHGSFARRSDFEILCFNLLKWLTGHLPWENCAVDKTQKIKEKYMDNIEEFLCFLFPKSTCPDAIAKLLSYVNDLDFEDEPDYNHCRKLLKDGLKMLKAKDDQLLFQVPKAKASTSKQPQVEEASDKENLKKANKRQTKRKEQAELYVDPSIIPTPAMLEIINKRAISEKVPKTRKK